MGYCFIWIVRKCSLTCINKTETIKKSVMKLTIIDLKNGWFQVWAEDYCTPRLVCQSVEEAIYYANHNADGYYL